MFELTVEQQAEQAAVRAFTDEAIGPYADQWDREERFPPALIREMARRGYLGAVIPRADGGTGSGMVAFGLLNEEVGRGCSSARGLITVHSMAAHALYRWGSPALKARYLAPLIAGDLIGAFALSEPEAGSDAASIGTTARAEGETYVLNGTKRWITFGQVADLFVLFAQCDGKHTAFLVEAETPGLSRTPISGMLGTRAAMLAELRLSDCVIPKANRLGGIGFGLAAVATAALDIGRYSVAWGSVGLIRACLEAAVRYSSERRQFGVPIKDHQLIRQMVGQIYTGYAAARALCLQAGGSKERGDPSTVMETWVAKYFASTTAMKAALDAVQIHGANGCSSDFAVQRYLRDAKISEIIEGSTQIQELLIGKHAYERV